MVGREASQSSVSLCEVSPPSILKDISDIGLGDVFDLVGQETSQKSVKSPGSTHK
jgi:hypothetical protein